MQKRGGSLKWKPKSQEAGPADEEGLRSSASTVLTNADWSVEEAITSPLLLAPSEGPKFNKMFMLRFFEKANVAQRLALAVDHTEDHIENQEVGRAAKLSLVDRDMDDEDAPKPGEKRAAQKKKREEREKKKSDLQDISNEQQPEASPEASPYPQLLAADGGPLTPFSLEPLKRALSQELRADVPSVAPDAELMAYLSGIQYTAPTMPEVSGGDDQFTYTTVMLRNIPNRYSRDMLAERLDQSLRGQYDFLYLPIDFSSKSNVGYAFINFRSPVSCMRFIEEFNGKRTKQVLSKYSCNKICEVTFAKVQGRDANMENLHDDKFVQKLIERPDWQPVFFDANGSKIPFSKTLERLVGTGKRVGKKDISKSPPISPQIGPNYGGPVVVPPVFSTPFHNMQPVGPLTSMLTMAGMGTTIMLRCIPVKYSRNLLLDRLNRRFKGSFDFIFLPPKVQGTSLCDTNLGFAFINFRSPQFAGRFTSMFHRVKTSICLPGVPSTKVCEVSQARLPNLEKHLENFQARSQTGTTHPGWEPLLFDVAGEARIFPIDYASAAPSGLDSAAVLPPNPVRALDSRALEFKLHVDAFQASTTAVAPPQETPSGVLQQVYRRVSTDTSASAGASASAAELGVASAQKCGLQPLGDGQISAIQLQIEFYFSIDNLCKDLFLRSKMDEQGWIALEIIARFPKVRKFGAWNADIVRAIRPSPLIEVDSTATLVRLRDEENRTKFSQVSEEYRSSIQQRGM